MEPRQIQCHPKIRYSKSASKLNEKAAIKTLPQFINDIFCVSHETFYDNIYKASIYVPIFNHNMNL